MKSYRKAPTGAAAGASDRVRVRKALQAAFFEGRFSLSYSEVRRHILSAGVTKGQPLPPTKSQEYRRADRSTERGLAALQEEGVVEREGERYRLSGEGDPWRAVVDGVVGLLTEEGLQPDAEERRNLRGVLIWAHPSGMVHSFHWVRPESRKDFLKKARHLVSRIGLLGYNGRPAGGPVPKGCKRKYTLEP